MDKTKLNGPVKQKHDGHTRTTTEGRKAQEKVDSEEDPEDGVMGGGNPAKTRRAHENYY